MIVYNKLGHILKERNMQWKDLCEAGVGTNTPTKFSKNRNMNTDVINKVCEYLHVQPSEIMEWIPDEEYNKSLEEEKNAEIASIEAQIEALKAKKEKLQN